MSGQTRFYSFPTKGSRSYQQKPLTKAVSIVADSTQAQVWNGPTSRGGTDGVHVFSWNADTDTAVRMSMTIDQARKLHVRLSAAIVESTEAQIAKPSREMLAAYLGV